MLNRQFVLSCLTFLFLIPGTFSSGAEPLRHGAFAYSVKGDKKGPNQDVSDFSISGDKITSFVADGHGPDGETHASIAGVLFSELSSRAEDEEDPTRLIQGIFKAIDLTLYETLQSGMPLKRGGTTLTTLLAFSDKDHSIPRIHIGYVGDSMAVVSSKSPKTGDFSLFTTKDHDFAKNPEEVQRFKSEGFAPVVLQQNKQMVAYYETNFAKKEKSLESFLALYPTYMREVVLSQITGKLHCCDSGPNMSRSMGDFLAKARVPVFTSIPEVHSVGLSGISAIILASDGLWELVSAEEAAKNCWDNLETYEDPTLAATASAKALVKLVQTRAAKHSYATDDTTVQVLFLNIPGK